MAQNRVSEYLNLLSFPICRCLRIVPLFLAETDEVHRSIAFYSRSDASTNLMLHALRCAEDHRFYTHPGIDIYAIARAATSTMLLGWTQGGSTIEQQLVRSLTNDRRLSVVRKFKEWVISSRLEMKFSKREILVAYLNCAYFGYEIRGYQHALDQLNLSENDLNSCATLAALIKRPMGLRGNEKAVTLYLSRIEWIAKRMKSHDLINFEKSGAKGSDARRRVGLKTL